MPLQNVVTFVSGIPERLHFTDHAYEQVTITDPLTGRLAPRNRLVMSVDEVNGSKTDSRGLPVIARLSILAEGLVNKIEPYLPNKSYQNYDFVITQTGTGYQSKYSMQVIPRK